MPELGTSGSVGAAREQSPAATRRSVLPTLKQRFVSTGR